jgi:toxin ParE1/3/4
MFPVRDFPSYLVFYRSTESGIEVLRVIHAARDIAAIFDEHS